MAIYHLEAKVISRGAGRSACAASAYMSCARIYNDYDGVQHDYTRKQGLVWQAVFLPPNAPQEWQDREKLWNAVESAEKTKDSRLAREFVVALPVELDKDQWQTLLTEYIQQNFVAEGMCADVAIHDPYPPGHNPHAHMMLTVRPLDEQGQWQYKTEKEYLCVRNGEERGFTAAEFKQAQADGWEKQYPYKIGKKQKEYMASSVAEAQGLERASKYPKSTKFGRQNPIAERWNSESKIILWRAAWADTTNRHLERAGSEATIDHRSHAERGLPEQPTIHEGVEARQMEKRGIISDRCELNRQIKADNAFLAEIRKQVAKLVAAVKDTIPKLAEAMEQLRSKLIVLCTVRGNIRHSKKHASLLLDRLQPKLQQFLSVVGRKSDAVKQRKALIREKNDTSVLNLPKQLDLKRQIADQSEQIEELSSEQKMILASCDLPEDTTAATFRRVVADYEAKTNRLEQQERRCNVDISDTLNEYASLEEHAASVDADQLTAERLHIRVDHESAAAAQFMKIYGSKNLPVTINDGKREVQELLSETQTDSVRAQLRHSMAAHPRKRNQPLLQHPERS